MSVQNKTDIRHANKRLREALSKERMIQISIHICNKIHELNLWETSKRIGFYHPIKNEINLEHLWQKAWLENKLCAFPVVYPQHELIFLTADKNTCFKKNRFGILEPVQETASVIPAEQLDIIFVPLLAFDDHCHRVGMGAGYYDRLLGKLKKPVCIGLAYDFQHVSELKHDIWDIPLDGIITESKIYSTSLF